jgi:predicted RNA-binding protein YlxR (DUF448 family)
VAVSTRTCIGCRRRSPATELVRLVVVKGRLHPGPRAGQAGRGASIHPREACVAAAAKSRAFARAFRMPGCLFQLNAEPNGDDAIKALVRDIVVAHFSLQPHSLGVDKTP